MKIIYNTEYGGFSWPQVIVDRFELRGIYDSTRANRTNPEIVAAIEQIIQPYIERRQEYDKQRAKLSVNQLIKAHHEFYTWCIDNVCTDLRVAEIPDDATDWFISEYDGLETVYFVKNGKIYYISDNGESNRATWEE